MSEATKKYVPHDRKFVTEVLRPVVEAQFKIDKLGLSFQTLCETGAERFGAEWQAFKTWCDANDVRFTLLNFIGYLFSVDFLPGGKAMQKPAGHDEPLYKLSAKKLGSENTYSSMYWAFSGLKQAWDKLVDARQAQAALETYDGKANKRKAELVAAGLSEEKVAELVRQELGPRPDAVEPASTDTPLKIFQKAFASALACITAHPGPLAEAVLKSFKLTDEGIATFRKNILNGQTGHPSIANAMMSFAGVWVEEHEASIIESLVRAGKVQKPTSTVLDTVVKATEPEPEPEEEVLIWPKAESSKAKRGKR